MATLVICEKKSAASRISYLLSDGDQTQKSYYNHPYYELDREGEKYICVPLRGHIIEYDYPKEYNNWGKVDEEDLIWVEPQKNITAKRIVNLLQKTGKEVDRMIVATDYDREGELIGLEAVRFAKKELEDIPVERARFSSLSKGEIEKAFSDLKEIDVDLAESAATRQIIDLAWGAVLTRFLSKASSQYGDDYLSVGRVQSPTLAIIVDKDHEIEEFDPEPYWKITALLEKDFEFEADYKESRIWEKEKADEVYEKVEEADEAKTLSFNEKTKKDWPPIPFNTTQFLSDANKLNLSPSQAMSTAEDLYTAGWISYPRTENTVYPDSLHLEGHLRKLKGSELSEEVKEILSQDKIWPTKGKKETTDHPPIYPIKPATKGDLTGNKWKVYELILRRFLATLAPYGIKRLRNAEFNIEGEEFKSKGNELIKKGWRKYYPYYKAKESKMPELDKGERVDITDVGMEEKETQPPSRYSQGKLVKIMEDEGLGTKSTRHGIIQKLYNRNFISGKVPRSTNSGRSVIDTLEKHAEMVTKPDMTRELEEDMQKIAEEDLEKEDVIKESRDMLQKVLKSLREEEEKIGKELKQSLTDQHSVGNCPECEDGILLIRKSKNGRFVGCSNYPDCKNTYSLPRSGNVKPGKGECPECGAPMVKVYHGGDTEKLCIDINCDHSQEQRYRGECPECGGDMIEQRSYKGKRFLGCSNYPECENTYPLPQKGNLLYAEKKCEECGAPIQKMSKKNKEDWEFCPNPDCSSDEDEEDK
ncbi:MAG: DNA topoisomerase I [Candidatus Thermoplasmatota archaeon]|nr:DNA topoisomerase I [Candidatus Thermoplasmatota archaeon]